MVVTEFVWDRYWHATYSL